VRIYATPPPGAKSNVLDCQNHTILLHAGSKRAIGVPGSSTIGRLS